MAFLSSHPLTVAIRSGDHEEARRLLARGPGSQACSQALWAALEVGAWDLAPILIPLIKTPDPQVLRYAITQVASAGHTSMFQELLPLCGKKNEAAALKAAVSRDRADIVRLLARRRTPMQVGEALMEYVRTASLETVAALLTGKVDRDYLGNALMVAATSDRTEVVDVLAARCDPDALVLYFKGAVDVLTNPLLSLDGPLAQARQLARFVPVSHLRTVSRETLLQLPAALARVDAAVLEEDLGGSEGPARSGRPRM